RNEAWPGGVALRSRAYCMPFGSTPKRTLTSTGMSLDAWAQGSDGWTWARAGEAKVRTASEAAARRTRRRGERIWGNFPMGASRSARSRAGQGFRGSTLSPTPVQPFSDTEEPLKLRKINVPAG